MKSPRVGAPAAGLVLALAALLLAPLAPLARAVCPAPCKCSETTVDCSDRPLPDSILPHSEAFASVTLVRARKSNFTCLRPVNLLYYPEAEVLDLRDNHIGADSCSEKHPLDINLQWSPKLKEVLLDNNMITSLAPNALPSHLKKLSLAVNPFPSSGKISAVSLEELNLDICALESLPTIGAPSLRVLRASHNALTDVDTLHNMKLLREVHLAHNYIATAALPEVLVYLEIVDLAYNLITDFTLLHFEGYRWLKVLNVSGNALVIPKRDPKMITLLALKDLGVANCGLDREGLKYFVDRAPQLERLDASGNAFNDVGGELLKGLPQLTQLSFRGCPLAALELAALDSLSKLKSLDVSETPLACGNGSADAMSPLLQWAKDQEVEVLHACPRDKAGSSAPAPTAASFAAVSLLALSLGLAPLRH